MKKTAVARVEALTGTPGVTGRIKSFSKHIFAQISLRPKAKAIHRDVRDGSRIARGIAHDLHAGVSLLSKKLDYLSAKLDAVAEVDDTIRQENLSDQEEREKRLTARLSAIEESVDTSGVSLLFKKLDYLSAKLDAIAEVDDTILQENLSDQEEREKRLTARLSAIEESVDTVADTLNAVLAEGHAARERARAEVAAAIALTAPMEANGPAARSEGLGDPQTPGEGADPSRAFIVDIEPFLYGQPITYVDVGAYEGTVFDQLLRSRLHVFDAHLVEPNPETFEGLKAKLATYSKPSRLRCHQFAVSDAAGVVTMRAAKDMSHVLPSRATPSSTVDTNTASFQVKAIPLDHFASSFEIEHIHLLKVDVEGHELEVFEGARKLLEKQGIDVIYVEAGLDPSNPHLTYYRAIEDVLLSHDYRLFRIYEQQHEWLRDSPLLRRINMAFMSTRFAANNSYRLTRELFAARRKNEELQREISRIKNVAAERIGLSSEAVANKSLPSEDDA